MVNLKNFESKYVHVVTVGGDELDGYVDAFCAAEDNVDENGDYFEDGICLFSKTKAGVFLLQSEIESIEEVV